ncbi:unnamed protein product [Echinostoma caproni]|uniref:Phosphorylase b kinase regulatory subunit n=1 Tax=Echinostoma caproni TaxID=27848 RepID=A0A183APF1_9TREM|nr:unnamed protein product [Echinostoma caproni]
MPEDPEAFLTLLESRSHGIRIAGQLSRYHKLLSVIQRGMPSNSRDIYMNTPAHVPYDLLKDALLRRMAICEDWSIQLLLSSIQLGNLNPSQLLQQMRALVGKTMLDDSILRQTWIQRRSPYV